MQINVTRADLMPLYKNQSEIARALGVTRGAVSQWGDKPLEADHILKLMFELHPRKFKYNKKSGAIEPVK